VRTGFIWLRTGTSGALSWTRYWNFGCHKRRVISWQAEWLLAFEDGICTTELVTRDLKIARCWSSDRHVTHQGQFTFRRDEVNVWSFVCTVQQWQWNDKLTNAGCQEGGRTCDHKRQRAIFRRCHHHVRNSSRSGANPKRWILYYITTLVQVL
jgi:hypothetical protein